MRSPAMALVWEYWRRCRMWMLMVLVATCGFMGVLYFSLSRLDYISAADSFSSLFFLFLMLQIVSFVAMNHQSQVDQNSQRMGFPYRLYALPVQTWRMIGWRMLAGAITGVLLMLISDGFFYLFAGVFPPLLGPLLLIVAVSACFQALIWALVDFRILKLLAVCVALTPLFRWTLHHYIEGHQDFKIILATNLTPNDILLLAGYIAGSYAVAVLGVRLDRRGNAQGFSVLMERWSRIIDCVPARSKPFRSPAVALFWAEWRRKGIYMPVVVGCILMIIFLSLFWGKVKAEEVLYGLAAVAVFGPTWAAFFMGILIGRTSTSQRRIEIGTFLATRPTGDGALASSILKAGLASTLLTWVMGAAFVLLYCVLLGSFGKGDVVVNLWNDVYSKTGILKSGFTLLLVAWTLMGLGISLTLIGRQNIVGGIVLFLLILFISFTFSVTLIKMDPHLKDIVLEGIGWVIGLTCGLGTVWAYGAAWRRGIIKRRTVLIAGGLYLITVLYLSSDEGRHFRALLDPGSWIYSLKSLFFLCLLALPLAPLATAPLALSVNRHR